MKITTQEFLRLEIEAMNLTLKNKAFVKLATAVADYILTFGPGKTIDYGCGTGVYSEICRKKGIDITAVDIWETHREYCRTNYRKLKVTDSPLKADTMLWIEVAEHMTDEEIKNVLDIICPQNILFSSTYEHTIMDLDWGHINIKPPGEWVKMFDTLGYDFVASPSVPTPWAMLLKKRN